MVTSVTPVRLLMASLAVSPLYQILIRYRNMQIWVPWKMFLHNKQRRFCVLYFNRFIFPELSRHLSILSPNQEEILEWITYCIMKKSIQLTLLFSLFKQKQGNAKQQPPRFIFSLFNASHSNTSMLHKHKPHQTCQTWRCRRQFGLCVITWSNEK